MNTGNFFNRVLGYPKTEYVTLVYGLPLYASVKSDNIDRKILNNPNRCEVMALCDEYGFGVRMAAWILEHSNPQTITYRIPANWWEMFKRRSIQLRSSSRRLRLRTPTHSQRKRLVLTRSMGTVSGWRLRGQWLTGGMMSKKTELEDALALQLDYEGIKYEREFKAIPGRDLSWDFLVGGTEDRPELLVEVHGGIWLKGGHSSGTGITRDCEKLCLGAIQGYAQFSVTGNQVKSGEAIEWILKYLGRGTLDETTE
jgi:hypothetical protein